jgi:uncharacterized repeat protein (TIGR01451 family)
MSRRTLAAAAAALPITLLTACQEPQPWRSELISVNAAGTGAANDYSDEPVFSPDGTMVAFHSAADDLGPTDTTARSNPLDIYVRDLATGTTALVSVNAAGTDSGNGYSVAPVFSPDSRKIAYLSLASDLAPGDTNDALDVYVRDLVAGTTSLVSSTAIATAGNGESTSPTFSPDSTRIAFESDADDLAGPDTNLHTDVYLRDLTAATTTLVSVNETGTDAGLGQSRRPTFAGDDRVVFESQATDLGPTDGSAAFDIYVRDLAAEDTSLVSANAAGTDSGNGASEQPVVSPDGTKVAFRSSATNLGPADSNNHGDLYLRDLAIGTTTLISVNAAGTNGGNGESYTPVFSPDGTKIAFVTNANDLGPPDTGFGWTPNDVYLRDLTTGTTSLVSVNAAGTNGGNGPSSTPVFSPDGARIAFTSQANDLGPKDTPRVPSHTPSIDSGDLYVRSLAQAKTTLVTANAAGTDSANAVTLEDHPGFDPTGRRIVFASNASDLGPPDDNAGADIYIATLHGADLSVAAEASPEPVRSGGKLTYDVVVTNDGPDAADAVVGAVLLPGGTAFTSADASAGSCSPPPPGEEPIVRCDLGNLANGDSATITVKAKVTAPASTVLTAIAGASSTVLELDVTDNYVLVESKVA